MQYAKYLLHERSNDDDITNTNHILHLYKLTQQFICDMYLNIESQRLNFVRFNQHELRCDTYTSLKEQLRLQAIEEGLTLGKRIILPSSFVGSKRYMIEKCNDAVCMFAKVGLPSLFITITANPKWKNITDHLSNDEEPLDRPDLVSRVFKLKVNEIIDEIVKGQIFGRVLAYAYTVEYQKRGNPHIHLLVTLAEEDKLNNIEDYDSIVSAEIPTPEEDLELHNLVVKHMIHGPHEPNMACLVKQDEKSETLKCSKGFPKRYCDETRVFGDKIYYKRRRVDYYYYKGKIDNENKRFDNKDVVPYNPYLTKRFGCHINVEICTSKQSILYLFKYVYKGNDRVTFKLRKSGDVANYDEILDYYDARYVSSNEAAWRIFGFECDGKSHSVVRLPVHLEHEDNIIFEDAIEEDQVEQNHGQTKLTAFFRLNQTDIDARNFLYEEIPYHYTFDSSTKTWNRRKRTTGDLLPINEKANVIVRLGTVSHKENERFSLRLLLQHRKFVTSFENLRTNPETGFIYNTFYECAQSMNLIKSSQVWDDTINEASQYQFAHMIRELFVHIVTQNEDVDLKQLFNAHKDQLMSDYLKILNDKYELNEDRVEQNKRLAYKLCLNDLNKRFRKLNIKLENYGFDMTVIENIEEEEENIDEWEEYLDIFKEIEDRENEELLNRIELDEKIESLNENQRLAFDEIMKSISGKIEEKLFYVDGPGGSGKTYLYDVIIRSAHELGKKVLPLAFTGIASNLLPNGRTLHSVFKFPIPITDICTVNISRTDPEAELLLNTDIILIDEISMVHKSMMNAMDKYLQELMDTNYDFGGKVIICGGDFRQCLPVLTMAQKAEIIQNCVFYSNAWRLFKRFELSTNMRSKNFNEFNKFLLDVGNGVLGENIPSVIDEKIIDLKFGKIVNNLILSVYGRNISNLQPNELGNRAILVTTNKKAEEINNEINTMLIGEGRVYLSEDSIEGENKNLIPKDQLHATNPSGCPPHVLILKKNSVIMLLRNLDVSNGLCNGTRLVVKELYNHSILATTLGNKPRDVLICRSTIVPSDTRLPFNLKRKQFPISLAFSLTINKAQGQSFERVGINLENAVFSHGQLYVALSRCKNPNNLFIKLKNNTNNGNSTNQQITTTKNVVFSDIFKLSNRFY